MLVLDQKGERVLAVIIPANLHHVFNPCAGTSRWVTGVWWGTMWLFGTREASHSDSVGDSSIGSIPDILDGWGSLIDLINFRTGHSWLHWYPDYEMICGKQIGLQWPIFIATLSKLRGWMGLKSQVIDVKVPYHKKCMRPGLSVLNQAKISQRHFLFVYKWHFQHQHLIILPASLSTQIIEPAEVLCDLWV